MNSPFCYRTLSPSDLPELWGRFEKSGIRPPAFLRAQGRPEAYELLKDLPTRGLAVVGTRHPQARSLVLVDQVLQQVATRVSLVIVSGLAHGIDQQAHVAALDSGLPTLAVIASGLKGPLSASATLLRTRILEQGGLILSEHPDEACAYPSYFLERNRLIAALSQAVWIVEAPARSGALNTATWARRLECSLYVTPGYPGDSSLAGNERLLAWDMPPPHALWGAHSLGSTWIPLATLSDRPSPSRAPASNSRGSSSPALADAEVLTRCVTKFAEQRGGTQRAELFGWASEQNWSAARFYQALHIALQDGRFLEKNGLLLKNPARSD